MNENKKTIWFVGVAVALLILALVLSPKPPTPEAFSDQGEQFFPDFTDPNTATTLEVVEVDTETGTPKAFKVTFHDGRWTIPSHHNYPADAKDQLAKTAAGVIDIRKDEYRTSNIADYDNMGVQLPTDDAVSPDARGKRITLRGQNGELLADMIIGNEVPDKPNFRFVRHPDQKRVYAAKVDLELSTNFRDWIDTDLLKVDKANLDRLIVKDYSIDERTGRMVDPAQYTVSKSDGAWKVGSSTADSAVISSMLDALDKLAIVGVRPKPEGLSKALADPTSKSPIDQSAVQSLQAAGFYLSRDGRLVANEGELQARTSKGILYTLRFGEVVYGSGMAVSAGTEEGDEGEETGENRYLFVTAEYDPTADPEPGPMPSDRSFQDRPDSTWTAEEREAKQILDRHARWERESEQTRQQVQDLNNRFADWYYVISSDSYQKLRVDGDSLKAKKN